MKRTVLALSSALLAFFSWLLLSFFQGLAAYREEKEDLASLVSRAVGVQAEKAYAAVDSEGQLLTVALGSGEEGQKMWIFVDEQEQYYIVEAEGLLQEEEAFRLAAQAVEGARIIHILPTMVKQRPVWEVFLQSPDGRYEYLFFEMEGGNQVRRYTLVHP